MSLKAFITKEETHPHVATRECESGWYASLQHGDKLYRMEYWDTSRYDPVGTTAKRLLKSLHVQGWFWGGCSSTGVWGWAAVSFDLDDKEKAKDQCAEFLMALREVFDKVGGGYNPHRIFVQCPFGRTYAFGRICQIVSGRESLEEALPRPAYRFDNRSHSSVEQRIYDVEVDHWWNWAERHIAAKAAKEKQNVQANPSVVAVGRNGIGQRPAAPGEFVAAGRL